MPKRLYQIWNAECFTPGPLVYEEDVEVTMLKMSYDIVKLLGLEPELLRIYGGPDSIVGWGVYHERMNGGPWPYAELVDKEE